MKQALVLLEKLTELAPPTGEKHHHMIADGGLVIGVWIGDRVQLFRLENEDFAKEPAELAFELIDSAQGLLSSPA